MQTKPRIGVSACLLGEAVRWDGAHKHHDIVAGFLAGHAELVPVCPEVELGLGTPREPIRLARDEGGVRLLGVESGADHTEAMRRYARHKVEALRELSICGYVLKARSPSCGMGGIDVLDPGGEHGSAGRGLFAARLIDVLARLPVVEESALPDEAAARDFLSRVLAFRESINQGR